MRKQRAFSALKRRVAENVRRLRLAAGLTQEAAAERADLDTRHWQKIEAGEQNLTIGTLAKLANGLRRDVSDLLQRPPRR